MAKPTQAKDAKPKATEGDDAGNKGPKEGIFGMNLLIMGVIMVLCTALSTAAAVYFLTPIVVQPMLASIKASGGEEGAEGEEGHEGGEEGGDGNAEEPLPHVGPVIDLEEFTVNLKDSSAERYARADLSITVTAEDPEFEKLEGEALHKWEEGFHVEMGHYVPAIRDIVISALTRRTAAELTSAIGKESLKEEIKRNTNAVFDGHRRVIRVNLENFIIQ